MTAKTFSEMVEDYSRLRSSLFNTREQDVREAHLHAIGAEECKYCGVLITKEYAKRNGCCKRCLEENQVNECEEVEAVERAVIQGETDFVNSFAEEG